MAGGVALAAPANATSYYDTDGTYGGEYMARADRQHALWLDGDDCGFYGDYPPATIEEE